MTKSLLRVIAVRINFSIRLLFKRQYEQYPKTFPATEIRHDDIDITIIVITELWAKYHAETNVYK